MSDQDKNSEIELLGRLLGPAEPELSCEQCFAQLDRYVELELSRADANAAVPGMRAHLRGCSACEEDHRSLRDLVESDPGGQTPPAAGSGDK